MESARPLSQLARLQAAFIAALVIALVAALFTIGTARAATITLTAELTAEAETEPGPEGATGSAVVTIDDETNEVCFELSIEGIDEDDFVTAAHIHVGAAGEDGDPVVHFFNEPPEDGMTGCVEDVDADLVAAILANPIGYYVNIHTDQHQAGAVRGQLVAEAAPAEPNCVVEVEPSTVAVGQDFVVSGNFGGAEIHLVRGDNPVAEDATPVATVPQDQDSFAVTFTAEAGDEGDWTVWAFIPASECGGSAALTIAAAVPDAAATSPVTPLPAALAALLMILAIPTLVTSVARR